MTKWLIPLNTVFIVGSILLYCGMKDDEAFWVRAHRLDHTLKEKVAPLSVTTHSVSPHCLLHPLQ